MTKKQPSDAVQALRAEIGPPAPLRPQRGGNRLTDDLPPGHYTRITLAKQVGMPFDTLKRWLSSGMYEPSDTGYDKKHGSMTIHVFTETDVSNLRQLCRERNVKHHRRPLPVAKP